MFTEELPINPDSFITTMEPGWNLLGNTHQPIHDITLLMFKYQGVFYNWTEATTSDNPLVNAFFFGWNEDQYYDFAV